MKSKEVEFYKRIGGLIQARRIENLLTQEDLAFLFGLTRVQVTMIESGKQKISVYLLVSIVDFFKMDLYSIADDVIYSIKTMDELKTVKVAKAIGKLTAN